MESQRGVDHQDAHLGSIDGALGTQGGVELDVILHPGPPAKPGGVDEAQQAALIAHDRVHRVAGGARHRMHHVSLFAEQPVRQGGLPGVGTSHDRDIDGRLPLDRRGRGKPADDRIEQIPAPGPHRRGYRQRLAEPQRIEVVHRELVGGGFDLVHRKEHGPARPPQPLRDRLVHRVAALLRVHQEEDQVGFLQGDLHLAPDRAIHGLGGAGNQAAGVHQPEMAAAPFGIAEVAVPGGAGMFRDDRGAAPEDAVEERGFADVRPADDRDDGDPAPLPCHVSRPPRPTARTGYWSFMAQAQTSSMWTCCSTLKSPDSQVK